MDLDREINSPEEAAQVHARITALWELAEARYQERSPIRRHIGCSYFVVDSRQQSDRSAYLSEAEAAEVHALTLRHSLYANDPARAHERVVQRLAALRAARRPGPGSGAPAEGAGRPASPAAVPLGNWQQLHLWKAA
jgi:hypothetical protein